MKYDKALNAARVFFILSCVMAHCLLSHSEMATVVENSILTLLSWFSCIGVPCFLVTSGILFRKKPLGEFIKGKAVAIGVPWLFCGTIVYFVSQFPVYSIVEYVKFIFGVGSFLYYIPVLLFCYLLFYILPDKKVTYVLCIALNCYSLVATQVGLIHLPSNFLNIANWIGYFAIGRWIAKGAILNKIRTRPAGTLLISLVFVIISCVVACMYEIESYFYGMLLIAVPFWFLEIYTMCVMFFENSRVFQVLGRDTYTIYLIHMPIAAFLKRIVRMVLPQGYIFLPVIVVAIVAILLEVYKRIIHKNKKLSELSGVLFGWR